MRRTRVLDRPKVDLPSTRLSALVAGLLSASLALASTPAVPGATGPAPFDPAAADGHLPTEDAASAADIPPGARVVADLAWDEDEPPAAFAVAADGAVYLAVNRPPRILVARGDGPPRRLSPRGGRFRPDAANLVDLLPIPGGVLVLDALAGTLWQVDGAGEVLAGHGLYVSPTSVRPGPGGHVLVDDPGTDSVVVLRPDLSLGPIRRRAGDSVAMLAADRLAYARTRQGGAGVQVGAIPLRDGATGPSELAILRIPADHEVLDTRLLSGGAGGVTLLTATKPRDAGGPTSYRLDSHPGRVGADWLAETALAAPENSCLDCGPPFRLGPDGALYTYIFRRDRYRVVRWNPKGSQG